MLGAIVSNRCAIVAASLLIILIALASLIVIDLLETLTISNQQYDVGSQEARIPPRTRDEEQESTFPGSSLNENQIDLVEELNNRLKSSERLRETPLLTRSQTNEEHWPQSRSNGGQSPILTRANYLHNKVRAQSPLLFKVDSPELPATTTSSPTQSVTKGVLKKAGSFQRVNSSADESDSDGDATSRDSRDRQMRRDLQNRRSLLNVRFAN